MKIIQTNILLLLLSINIICITSSNKDAVEFHLGETVIFDSFDNNYFKLNYDSNNNITVFLLTRLRIYSIVLTDPNGNFRTIESQYVYDGRYMEFNLDKKGIYYFNFNQRYNFALQDESYFFGNAFSIFVVGETFSIDLTEKMYFNPFKIESRTKHDSTIYKVENLKKDTYVFFYFEETYYYYRNPFEICSEDNDCIQDVTVYKFLAGKKYTIKVNFIGKSDSEYYYYDNYNFYYPFVFFPILDNTIETKQTGHFTVTEPKIYNIYSKDTKVLCGFFENYQATLTSSINEKITTKNLDNLLNLNFVKSYSKEYFSNETDYHILVIIPSIETANSIEEVAITENILTDISNLENGELTIPAGKTQVIILETDYRKYRDDNGLVELYNVLTTYSSSEKNMRLFLSYQNNDKYDFMIMNYLYLPIIIDNNNSKDVKIKFKTYFPRYTFFGAANGDLYNLFYHAAKEGFLRNKFTYEPLEILKKQLPLNARVNSDLSPFYEFFNFYFHDFKENINLYINKLYGETDLYECNESLDLNDLSILTTPISNCKGKKSIFNRLFTLKGTKILSGYLSHNSYFDIYLEFNEDNNNKIKISNLLKDTINSASKYIKKDIEYTIDFDLDHMVKIEPGKNVEVKIYNGEETIILNKDNINKAIIGENFKVKSNGDIMIYFYGRLFNYIKQIKIDPEESGKNLLIRSDRSVYFGIDTGFKGFNPLNIGILADSRLRESYYYYIENIYEKIKNKLAKNENLYLFYADDDNDALVQIDYIGDNLNNPNNDYNFNVIPKNSADKTLIIYNRNLDEIRFNINFCKSKEDITMYYEDYRNEEKDYIFKKDNPTLLFDIEEYGTKLRFKSTEDFIFSYSFVDFADNKYANTDKWIIERKELTDLKINEIKDKNSNDNVLLINFNPNYKNSNTKYIIVIAPEEGDNTEDNFNSPCYLAKLVTDRPSGVKVVNFFDVGEKDSITAEVDISDILNKNNKYIANIISQELRFDKKLNFYSPKKFSHEGKYKPDDGNDSDNASDNGSDNANDKSNGNGNGNGNNTTLFVAIGSVVGVIIIVIAIILIIKCLRKPSVEQETKSLNKDDKLLQDI